MDKTDALRAAASLLAALGRLAACVAAAVVATRTAWTEERALQVLEVLSRLAL